MRRGGGGGSSWQQHLAECVQGPTGSEKHAKKNFSLRLLFKILKKKESQKGFFENPNSRLSMPEATGSVREAINLTGLKRLLRCRV